MDKGMDSRIGRDLFRPALDEGLAAWGLALSEQIRETLCGYLCLLADKNRVMNLTAVTEPGEMVRRHLLDSLAPLRLGLADENRPLRLVDVGTGAGLPGLPLAIALPEARTTLLDSQKKRLDFLDGVLAELAVPNAQTRLGRAEELAHQQDLREGFDIATARAVAELRTLAEYCLPYVRVGGLFLPLKSGEVEEELRQAEPALRALGGTLLHVEHYRVPGEDIPRTIPVIRKTAPCDRRYPRRQSRIVKDPL